MAEEKRPTGYKDLLQSIDEFFQHTFEQWQHTPLFHTHIPVRITENEHEWIAEVKLAGIEKEQIRLHIKNQTIYIQVIHKEELKYVDEQKGLKEEKNNTHIQKRIIQVPFVINEKHVKATYVNGLLRITIPMFHRKISIE